MNPMPIFSKQFRSASLALVGAIVLAGCDSDPVGPVTDPGQTITVDATSAWGFLDLATPAQVITVDDATTSTAWDMAFLRTGVQVNGGESGPGGILVHCICQNAGLTDEEVIALTAEGELPEFEQTTADDIPSAATAWSATAITDEPWYRYNILGGHQIWPTFQVYLVKRGAEVFKVQITSYYGDDGTPRQITVRYARLAG